MRVAAVASDLVAPDAVGGRTLIVAPGAKEDVTTRFTSVTAHGTWIVVHPAGRMRIARADRVGAHAALDVAGVARLRRVTGEAPRRIRLSFHRVPRDEIAAMHEVLLDRVGTAPFDGQVLSGVVAHVAIGLRVARPTEALFGRREAPVATRELAVVTQKSLRHDAG